MRREDIEIPRVRRDGQEEIENVPVKERSKTSGPHPINVVRRQLFSPSFKFFFFFPNRRIPRIDRLWDCSFIIFV